VAQQLTTAAAQTDSPDTDQTFIHQAFETILSRSPTEQEITACRQFLSELPQQLQTADETFPAGPQTAQRQPSPDPAQRARENLLVVLFSHNDFVTIR
jgi:hypothetical protein